MKKRSRKIDATIISGVARGVTLARLCRKHGIARTTLAGWIRNDPALAARLASAKDMFCDALVDECLVIADDSSNDWIERPGGKGGRVPNLENIRRSKHAIDARWRRVAQWDRVDFHQSASRTADADAEAFNAAVIDAMRTVAAKLESEGKTASTAHEIPAESRRIPQNAKKRFAPIFPQLPRFPGRGATHLSKFRELPIPPFPPPPTLAKAPANLAFAAFRRARAGPGGSGPPGGAP